MNIKYLFHKYIYTSIKTNMGPLITLGNKESWTILPRLSPESFVVSGGAGHDISFELELIDRFGCMVVLLDPSLPGRRTYEQLNPKPKQLIFHPLGLAATSGMRYLAPPEKDPHLFSWRISKNGDGEEMQFICLKEILNKYNKDKIDLLKIDIEGFEYEVLGNALKENLAIKQVCVEIHQGPKYEGRTQIDRWILIMRLLFKGYIFLHNRGRDHTFYSTGCAVK